MDIRENPDPAGWRSYAKLLSLRHATKVLFSTSDFRRLTSDIRRYRLGAEDTALSRRRHGFESR